MVIVAIAFGGIMKILAVLLLFIASTAYGEIYTWKDARGTVFYTNSLHEIPARYRSRAKLLDVATGKKLPLTAGQSSAPPTGQTAPPPPAQVAQPQPSPVPVPNQQNPAGTPPPASTQPTGVQSAQPEVRPPQVIRRQRDSRRTRSQEE